jgi:hypothetical protein
MNLHAQGVPVWLNSAGSPTGDDEGRSIALDSLGNVYVVGTFTGKMKLGAQELTSNGAKDIVVACYTSDGVLSWAKNFGGEQDEVATSIVCNTAGTLTISGTFLGTVDFGGGLLKSNGALDGFILRLSSSGNTIWATKIGGPSDDLANGVAIDEIGNCYVTGAFSDTLGFSGGKVPTLRSPGGKDIYIMKLSDKGVAQWAKRAGGISYDEGISIVYDSRGFVTMAGTFWGKIDFPGGSATDLTSFGNYDVFIAQYSIDGIPRWSQRIGGGNDDSPRGLTKDDSGNIYLTGTYTGQAGFSGSTFTLRNGGMFLVQYTIDGFPQWVSRVGNDQSDIGNSVAVDKNGNVYVVGNFYSTTNFGLSNVVDVTSAGKSDMILACYNTIGTPQWAMRAGGSDYDNANSIAVNNQGELFITGDYRATADFPGGSLSSIQSSGKSDIFVVRYNVPKFTIIGYITFNALPFEGVSVTDGTRKATTDKDGIYEIKNVPNGTYTVTPSKQGYEFIPPSTKVTVKDITPAGINFVARFVLLPPELVAPLNNATKVSLSTGLEWKATVGAKRYHVQISTLPLFPTTIFDDSTLTSLSIAPSNLDVSTEYYWRVCATDGTHWSEWSEVRRFVTAEKLPGQVLLTAPQNQSKDQLIDQLFSWKILPSAAYYHFQLATSSDFSSLIRDDSAINVIVKKVDGLDYNTRYYWKVQGFVEGVWGAWSDTWNFQTAASDAVAEFAMQEAQIEIHATPSPITNGESLLITFPAQSVGTITIISILGEKIMEFSAKEKNGAVQLNVANWQSGMYIAALKIADRTVTTSFIILK